MLACALAPSWAAAQAGDAEAVDSGWILRSLARPAPASTPFVELRESALLDAPLRVSGQYRRPDEDTLVRQVDAPYAETTTIRGGRATVEREGRPPRSFSLSRAPELAGLQASFGALLAGDHAALERHYAIRTAGEPGGWVMTMAPRDAALARRVRDIVLYGRNDELHCIQTRSAGDEVQRTLLGSAAQAAPDAADAQAVQALCHGGAGR